MQQHQRDKLRVSITCPTIGAIVVRSWSARAMCSLSASVFRVVSRSVYRRPFRDIQSGKDFVKW